MGKRVTIILGHPDARRLLDEMLELGRRAR
jgi:hypothetical protein